MDGWMGDGAGGVSCIRDEERDLSTNFRKSSTAAPLNVLQRGTRGTYERGNEGRACVDDDDDDDGSGGD